MAELMVSAFLRKKGGVSLRKTQAIRAATIAKLIHLKISLARCVEAVPPSSAACAHIAEKSKIAVAVLRSLQALPRLIELLSLGRPVAENPAASCGRFPSPVGPRKI